MRSKHGRVQAVRHNQQLACIPHGRRGHPVGRRSPQDPAGLREFAREVRLRIPKPNPHHVDELGHELSNAVLVARNLRRTSNLGRLNRDLEEVRVTNVVRSVQVKAFYSMEQLLEAQRQWERGSQLVQRAIPGQVH
jgi:hypothetical protein